MDAVGECGSCGTAEAGEVDREFIWYGGVGYEDAIGTDGL